MISLAQNMWSRTRVHFPLRHLAKEHLQLARKVTFFSEIEKETVRLFDSRSQLSKRTFCKILSNCRSERDVETGEIGQNQDITSDSEDLTAIWSRRRSVRPPRHMEDFFKYQKSFLDVWLQVGHDSRTTPATSIF